MDNVNLEALERTLPLMDYERIAPLVTELNAKGYDTARIAAIMYRYGWTHGRQVLKETQKARKEAYRSKRQEQRENNKDSQTSGENEGSV